MRRVLIQAALLAFAAAALAALPTGAQGLPSKKEAAAMMQKAFAAMDLTSPGSPPFHLVARVHYELAGDSHDGTYELIWTAPDLWREDFRMDGVEWSREIVFHNELSIQRSGPTPSLALFGTRGLLQPRRGNAFAWKLDVNKVSARAVKGTQTVCIESKREDLEEHACFDSETNELRSIQDTIPRISDIVNLERDDFVAFGGKRYPAHFVSRYFDEKIDIHVGRLTAATDFTEGDFVPPSDTLRRDWCADPVEKGDTNPPPPPLMIDRPAPIAYFVLVGPDGKVEHSQAIRAGALRVDGQIREWLRTATFPLRTCEGKPIAYEQVFSLPRNLH